MRITKLSIRRFKRFEDVTFDLRGHVVLAGPNNCGKTTVLQAIATWSLALKRWQELNDLLKHKGAYSYAPLSRLAFNTVPLRSFELLWRDKSYGGSIEIEAELDPGGAVTMEIVADSTEQVYVRPRKDVPRETLAGLSFGAVYLATVGGLSVVEPVYQPDYIETLLGQQRPGEVVRNLLWQVSQGNSWTSLVAAVDRLFGVELQVPQTPGGAITCEYRSPAGLLDILSGGSGFQQVLLLLATLYSRKGSIILVDEPDAHLHSFLQDSILSELDHAAIDGGCQLVIATHSEVILNSVEPERVCLMVGEPRRLTSPEDLARLRRAVGVLPQSDLLIAPAAPGILYLEGYTDLNLLREWARVLGHPVADYLNRKPFWRPEVSSPEDGPAGIPAGKHFEALRLVNPEITGVWIMDADGKARGIPVSAVAERGALNRLSWQRYEAESYLVHPEALIRFAQHVTNQPCADAIIGFFAETFGRELAEQFRASPLAPPTIVENYLRTTKARTEIVGKAMQSAGWHNFTHSEFSGIAARMTPEEIHPEVREKLDFIQQAFGL